MKFFIIIAIVLCWLDTIHGMESDKSTSLTKSEQISTPTLSKDNFSNLEIWEKITTVWEELLKRTKDDYKARNLLIPTLKNLAKTNSLWRNTLNDPNKTAQIIAAIQEKMRLASRTVIALDLSNNSNDAMHIWAQRHMQNPETYQKIWNMWYTEIASKEEGKSIPPELQKTVEAGLNPYEERIYPGEKNPESLIFLAAKYGEKQLIYLFLNYASNFKQDLQKLVAKLEKVPRDSKKMDSAEDALLEILKANRPVSTLHRYCPYKNICKTPPKFQLDKKNLNHSPPNEPYFFIALNKHNWHAIQAFLNADPVGSLTQKDSEGNTALMFMAKKLIEAVEWDLKTYDNQHNRATYAGHVAQVPDQKYPATVIAYLNLLLQNGASITTLDQQIQDRLLNLMLTPHSEDDNSTEVAFLIQKLKEAQAHD